MSPVAGPLARLARQIADLSAALGAEVELDLPALTDRTGHLPLGAPGLTSPNGACRMIEAADGWIAVNLARSEDLDLLSAWLGVEAGSDPWGAVGMGARPRGWRELVDGARLLGLPVGGVGEVRAAAADAALVRAGAPGGSSIRPTTVVDLSTLWAGPLCGAVLAAAGAQVTRIESRSRPDPSRTATPEFYRRLNAGKQELALDFADPAHRRQLRERILAADVVITSARPRAFAQLGLQPDGLFADRPDLVWVAVSGYGWTCEASDRVAFGDDAAAAGGLVRWTPSGQPHFLGDALADPLTGLAAAAGALRALQAGGGVIVDAALARTSAGAAAELGLMRGEP